MTETTTRSFIDGYIAFLEITARDGEIGAGIPAMTLDIDEKLSVFCLMLSPEQIFEHMEKWIREKKPVEVAFGLDRYVQEGQGVDTKYDSIFTIYYMNAKKQWSTGVFPYNKAGEFDAVDWDNLFWRGVMASTVQTLSKLSKEVYHE